MRYLLTLSLVALILGCTENSPTSLGPSDTDGTLVTVVLHAPAGTYDEWSLLDTCWQDISYPSGNGLLNPYAELPHVHTWNVDTSYEWFDLGASMRFTRDAGTAADTVRWYWSIRISDPASSDVMGDTIDVHPTPGD